MKHGLAVKDGRGRPSEDRSVWIDLSGETALCGVLDGHSGSFTVEFTTKKLPERLKSVFTSLEGDDAALTKALKQAFIEHDKLLASQGAIHYRDSGTTATIVYIGKKSVVFAFVGDSPACILDPDTGKVLTTIRKHDPLQPDEQRRILKNGGSISQDPDDAPRVNGCLMVSRAFGDFSLKFEDARGPPPMGKNWATDFCVTAEPDVVIVPRPAKGILAVMSDGLVENAEDELKLKPIGHVASAIASQIRKASGDLNKAAEATVVAHMMESVTALSEYSGDDLTLLLADIGNPIGGGHIPFQTPFTRKAGSGRRRARTNRVKRIPKTFVIS